MYGKKLVNYYQVSVSFLKPLHIIHILLNILISVKCAANNPHVKQAGSNLGKTAVTVTETINNVLLPLAAVNYAFNKAKVYFSERFQKELKEKTSSIPPEHIVEPKASIAGPTLQGLAFSHEEANLKDMYLSLLATSMDNRVAAEVHPAFVKIIKQLDSEEAQMFKELSESSPICQIKLTEIGGQGWENLATHLLDDIDSETELPTENPRAPAMVDNLMRLGLISVDYLTYLVDKEKYDWVDKRPEVIKLREQFENDTHKVVIEKGVLERTTLGIQFAKSVGLYND